MKPFAAAVMAVLVTGLSLAGCGSSGNPANTLAACRYVAANISGIDGTDPVGAATKMRDRAEGSQIEGPANDLYRLTDETHHLAAEALSEQKTSDMGALARLVGEAFRLRDKMAAACTTVGVEIPALTSDGRPTFDPSTLPPCLREVGIVYTFEQVVAMAKGCRETPNPRHDASGLLWVVPHQVCADGHAFAYLPVEGSGQVTSAIEVSVPGPGKTGTSAMVPIHTATYQSETCKP